jgi:LIVCS family branched-chain amino acid:cation transporter
MQYGMLLQVSRYCAIRHKIVLILLCLCGGWFHYDRRVFVAVTAPTLLAACLDFLNALPDGAFPYADGLLDLAARVLPLFRLGLGWVVPALLGLAVGLIWHAAAPASTA